MIHVIIVMLLLSPVFIIVYGAYLKSSNLRNKEAAKMPPLLPLGMTSKTLLEHTHYYEEEVEITEGFYAGHTGKVIDYVQRETDYAYRVRLPGGEIVLFTADCLQGVY